MAVSIREARKGDAQECGRICYEAFAAIAGAHNFPPDFPSAVVAVHLTTSLIGYEGSYGVVAEENGKIIGSNFLDERNSISGVGPITVDPRAQNSGAGALLMRAVMERSIKKGFAGIRLVQAGYHMRSLSLYSKLGFDVREHLSCINGKPIGEKIAGYEVRAGNEGDETRCNALCARIHGATRRGEVKDALLQGSLRVVERSGRITGYTTNVAFFGHSVSETTDDLKALIASADVYLGPGFLVPSRNGELMRWCLQRGLRVIQPLTLMTMGLYSEPQGAYLPSILY